MKRNTTHNLTVAAMLSAVAFILMFIEFPIPMLIPSFVKMDFSDLPALLGAFALGPVYGAVISFHEEPAPHCHQGHQHRVCRRTVQLHAGRGLLGHGGLHL